MFKSSDELLNTCGRCCSWHGRSGKLAPRPGERGRWRRRRRRRLLLRPAAVFQRLTSSSRLAGALHSSSKALSSRASQSGCFSRTPKFKADTQKSVCRKPHNDTESVTKIQTAEKQRKRATTVIIWRANQPVFVVWGRGFILNNLTRFYLPVSLLSCWTGRNMNAPPQRAQKKTKNGPSECFNRVYHSGALTQQNYSWLLPTLDNGTLT